MKQFKQFLAAALVAISASAMAHGDEAHAKKAGPVGKATPKKATARPAK